MNWGDKNCPAPLFAGVIDTWIAWLSVSMMSFVNVGGLERAIAAAIGKEVTSVPLLDTKIRFPAYSADPPIYKLGFPEPVATKTFSAYQAEVKDLHMLKW
jgi:hypothetical protein